MGRILRIVTLLCYFLPFTFFLVTCNDGMTYSYNQKEADKNIAAEKKAGVANEDTTATGPVVSVDSSNKTAQADTTTKIIQLQEKPSRLAELWDAVLTKIARPTEKSLSGISSVYLYKNREGQVLIAVSILLSLIVLILWRFLRRKQITVALLLTNLFCFIALIIDSLVSQITLLWGAWTIFGLLIWQIWLEIRDKTRVKKQ